MLFPPQPPGPLVQSWLDRHRHPISFTLHIVGIPLTILGVLLIPVYLLAGSFSVFLFALVLFVGGYAIQFLGHAVEGTDPGEIILLKRKLGLPYVEFPPIRSSRRGVA
jgi:hypothetical protein